MKKIFIEEKEKYIKIAILEDNVLVEFFIEESKNKSKIGNIYKARVNKILEGINACFLKAGKEKFFMQIKGNEDIKEKEVYLVQVQKDVSEKKSPVVTTNISLPSRYLIYSPLNNRGGISRKITDKNERERLKAILKSLHKREGSFIIRTEAKDKGKKELKRDVKYLYRLWDIIRKKELKKESGFIYELNDIVLTVIREKFNEDVEKLVVNEKNLYKKIISYVKTFMPILKKRVILEKEKNLFKKYGINQEINKILSPKVELPSGGHIVIEKTEALTSVDVNSGSVIKGNPEEEISRINHEAAKEIMRQIKLRNIGGIIIIDFIEMKKRKNKDEVFRILQEEAKKDKAKIDILPLTKLGLVEMTRQHLGEDVFKKITVKCPYCSGRGFLPKKGI